MNFQQEELSAIWKKEIEAHTQTQVELYNIGVVSGGSISQAYKVNTSENAYFLKTNQADKFPDMFATEFKGLQFLRDKSDFQIPNPIATGALGETQWILTTFIQPAQKDEAYWENFGKNLANLHKHSDAQFGLDHNNYFGSLPQINQQYDDWESYFIENRIEPQLKLAIDSQKLSADLTRRFQRLFGKLKDMMPQEKPAAIHGDLWSGNFMTDQSGNATIFDPAVYYGHREVDIAMTQLFGSLNEKFYASYNEHFPLEQGWQERVPLFNLYPLLAHVNLFSGGGYEAQVTTILRHLA